MGRLSPGSLAPHPLSPARGLHVSKTLTIVLEARVITPTLQTAVG